MPSSVYNHVSKRGLWYTFVIVVLSHEDRNLSVFNTPVQSRNNQNKLGQSHSCWCFGSTHRQAFIRHDIKHMNVLHPGLPWWFLFSNNRLTDIENDAKDRSYFYKINQRVHDDDIEWKHFPHHWPFVQGIHRSLVISPHKGQWRGALIFSSICAWPNCWANNREAGDLRRHRAHYDVHVMNINYTEIQHSAYLERERSDGKVYHDDVIKWKHFPRYWPFVLGIHRSLVNSSHKGQWRGALMFSLICAWINGWINTREAGYLRRHHGHYDVTVMI